MIVQPNFLDHWKTNALAATIGRLEAITALLALWSHCQNQRTWQFPDNELMIAGICRFTGNPRVLIDTLLQLNLLEKVGENTLEVHEWAETNAKLLHNWDAGKKGGRPPKQPKDKPTENPRVNPWQTQGQPKGEPIREDKIREENTPLIPQGGNESPIISDEVDSPASNTTEQPKKKKRGARLEQPVFPPDLPAAFHQPLTDWFNYKRETGKGYSPSGWNALIAQQQRWPAHQVAQSVEASMANNWAGLFTDRIQAAKNENARNQWTDPNAERENAVGKALIPSGGGSGPEGWREAMDALEGPDWHIGISGWPDLTSDQRQRVTQHLTHKTP
jgi:hypothetical protein